MSTLADTTISALRRNHDQLAARVATLSSEDLAKTSGASEWDVAQVLSHLGSGAEIALAGLEAGVAGDEEAPGQDFNQGVWDRWNAMSAQEKADGYLAANERLVDAFEGLDAAARENLRVKLSFLPFPADVALLAGMRLNEAAMHRWDVEVAFDPEAALSFEETSPALDQLTGPLSFYLGFLAKSAALNGTQTTLRVQTSNPDRAMGLVLGESVSLGDAPSEGGDVLTLPAEAFLRLIAGRLGPAHTPESVTLTGSDVTLDQLRGVFTGF